MTVSEDDEVAGGLAAPADWPHAEGLDPTCFATPGPIAYHKYLAQYHFVSQVSLRITSTKYVQLRHKYHYVTQVLNTFNYDTNIRKASKTKSYENL